MKSFQVLCLIVFLLAVSLPSSRNASLSQKDQNQNNSLIQGKGLYSPEDDVYVLSNKTFNYAITDAPIAWLIEFYSSWCGFCQRFAPTWKAFATDIRDWQGLVMVGAIDCSVDDNFPICREYEIMGYPTLRYFHEGFHPGPNNFGVEVKKGEDVDTIRRYLVERMIQEKKEGRGLMYPKFDLYTLPNPLNMLDDISERNFGFLILENSTSVLGEEVALDFHNVKQISIRIAHDTNSALRSYVGALRLPALITLDKNEKLHILNISLRNRGEAKEAIRRYLYRYGLELIRGSDGRKVVKQLRGVISKPKRTQEAPTFDHIKTMGDVVLLGDLETALRRSLYYEVGINKVFEGEKLEALKAYFKVLDKYFPFNDLGRHFIQKLIEDSNAGSIVRGNTIAKTLDFSTRMENIIWASPNEWLGCKGSTPSRRGYPCGLWKMFHYLTVNATQQNIKNPDANPREVLEAMYGYIKYFFGCSECSGHFLEMAERRQLKNVSSFNSSVLWLWEAHNEVNNRLHGDVTEDPEYPKIQFPSNKSCPTCGTVGHWNESEVLNYLKNMYGNLKFVGSDLSIFDDHLMVKDKGNSSDPIKNFDMSMCFILYVSAFLLLAVLIRMFLKRGYRKKPYVHDILGKV